MEDRESFVGLMLECIVRFAGVEREAAREMIECSRLFDDDPLPPLVTHEEPYFWAMHLVYGREGADDYWWLRPGLWPPPAAYRDLAREWAG